MLTRVKWFAPVAILLAAGLSLAYSGIFFAVHPQTEWGIDEYGLKTHTPMDLTTPSNNITYSQCPTYPVDQFDDVPPVLEAWDKSQVVNGPPTKHFRDNLRDDMHYVTAWSNAGFTNQFMSYVNMIYLGTISNRVPIIPPFGPDHHISGEAGALPFGQIFNLTRLRQAIRQPVLEWLDVKDLPSARSISKPADSELEQLGCWSTRHGNDPKPARVASVMNNLQFDVSYTRAPTAARLNPSDGQDDFLVFSKLVPYIFPHNPLPPPDGSYPLMQPSPLGHRLPPNERLSCFDHLYFTTAGAETYEWRFSWSPVWRFVGTHLHFTDSLVETASGYLSRAFQATGELPLFIAVHMRRGDFANQCSDTPGNCLIPMSIFLGKVDQVKKQLLHKHNKKVTEVLLFSDETDPAFWEQARSLGWAHFDHTKERTKDILGEWFVPIVDIVAQSMAAGFVGTEDSTFSLVSSRRVEDWNNGPVIIVTRKDQEP
ncbi:hypothetical protein B0H34DRAFT_349230 [Crassisporium funariophilum]|nr:hypothetical protein B0H34DRAFT_349230 [Crassisporium funariophilum]